MINSAIRSLPAKVSKSLTKDWVNMPWTIHIDPDVNCVFINFNGIFELDHVMGVAKEMFNHPDYRVGMNILRDTRELQIPADVPYDSLANEIERVMDEFGNNLENCRTAIVVSNVHRYAKVHQYIVAGRLGDFPIERQAFEDVEKALAWLSVPEGYESNYPATGETT